MAVIALLPVHTSLALAHTRAVTQGAYSSIGVTAAGQAASGAIVEVAVLTPFTLPAGVAL